MSFKKNAKENLSSLYKDQRKISKKIKDIEEDIADGKFSESESKMKNAVDQLKDLKNRYLEIEEKIDNLIPEE